MTATTRSTSEPASERTVGCVSTFALDVHWSSTRSASGAAPAGASGAELVAHLDTCGRCRGYLARLDALAGNHAPTRLASLSSQASAPPGSIAPSAPIAKARMRWQNASSVASVAGALALAAAITLFVRSRAQVEPHDAYVGLKGTPAVQLLLHRDRDTQIWDGHAPLHAGDALALRVACEGMTHVAIATPGPDAAWERLSDATCTDGDAPLPFTLQVDDAPGDERLAVVLSQEDLDAPSLRQAIADTRRTANVWVVSFVMPKEPEKNR